MKYLLKKRCVLVCLVTLLIINFLLLNKLLHENFSINFEMIDYPEIGIATLYFDDGSGVTEKAALRSIADEDIITFDIPILRYNKIVNLRFDPINFAHNVEIERISFCFGKNEVYSVSGAAFLDGVSAYAGIYQFDCFDEKGTVFCENNTPIIYSSYAVVEAYNYYYQRFVLIMIFKIIGLVLLTLFYIYIICRYLKEEALYVMNIINNRLCIKTNKKYFVITSFAVYLIVRIFVLMYYRGYYFNDEFYFLAESNPDYSSTYHRAPYIAFLIKIFTQIAGSQYFAVKAVPLFCGIVSFACVIYLSYTLCSHSVSILLAAMLMTFHSLFIFNDFYVRMYCFQEMELLILTIILYRAKNSRKWLNRTIWLLIGLFAAYRIYYLTTDISGTIPLISYICAIIYILAGEQAVVFLKNKGWFKVALVSIGSLFLIFEGFVILIKNKVIVENMAGLESKLIRSIYRLMTEFRIEDSAFLIKYLLIDAFFFTISFVLAGIWMIKKERNDIFPIFLLSAVPLTCFVALIYNGRIVRTFIGYIAIMVVVVILFWDYAMEKRKCALGIIFACIITVVASPIDLSWKQFSEQLYLYQEIFFCDYEQLMQDACSYKNDGTKVAAMFGGEQVLAYFRFEPDINLCVWDNNQEFYDNKELVKKLEELVATEEEFILIMDRVGADKLHEIGMYYTLLEQYEYKIYNRNEEFHSLFLVIMK